MDWVFIIFILDIPVRLLLKLHYRSVSVQELFGDLLKDCLLYTSDAADEEDSVDFGGRRIIKKKKREDL